MRKYYIWWDRGRLTITVDKPRNIEYSVTYQSDITVKNWHSSIDWYAQTQAILQDLWDQDHREDDRWYDEGGK
jgi:hypothetical protein